MPPDRGYDQSQQQVTLHASLALHKAWYPMELVKKQKHVIASIKGWKITCLFDSSVSSFAGT